MIYLNFAAHVWCTVSVAQRFVSVVEKNVPPIGLDLDVYFLSVFSLNEQHFMDTVCPLQSTKVLNLRHSNLYSIFWSCKYVSKRFWHGLNECLNMRFKSEWDILRHFSRKQASTDLTNASFSINIRDMLHLLTAATNNYFHHWLICRFFQSAD